MPEKWVTTTCPFQTTASRSATSAFIVALPLGRAHPEQELRITFSQNADRSGKLHLIGQSGSFETFHRLGGLRIRLLVLC